MAVLLAELAKVEPPTMQYKNLSKKAEHYKTYKIFITYKNG